MKPQKTPGRIGLVLGLCLAPLAVQATVTSPILVALTAYVEVGDTVDNIYKSKIVKTRITTKDLLSFLSDEANVVFPDGAYLEVDPDGPVHVKGPENFDQDVSDLVSTTFSINDNIAVFGGVYNNETTAEKSTGMFLMSLTVKNAQGDTVATVSGLATEKYNAGTPANGVQKIVASVTAVVAGSGSLDGNTALLSGKLTMKANDYFETDN